MGWGGYGRKQQQSVVCPARAAPGDNSGHGTMPHLSTTFHPLTVPSQVSSSPPSSLDISGDVSPAPTGCLHLGPGPLLFTCPQSWPRFTCSSAHLHQKAIVRACLHPTTMPQSGGQLVLPLSCILHDSAQRGQPWQGLLSPSSLAGAGGEVAAETRRARRQQGLGNPPVFNARGGLRRCRHPREVAGSSFEAACPASACQLPPLPRLPTKHRGREAEGEPCRGPAFGGMVGCPRRGRAAVPPMQHWKAGFRSGGCELWPWPFGSSSPLP